MAGVKNGGVDQIIENSTYKVSALGKQKPEQSPEWDVFDSNPEEKNDSWEISSKP